MLQSRRQIAMLSFRLITPRLRNASVSAVLPESSMPETKHREEKLIERFCREGKVDSALDMLFQMESLPSDTVYLCLLKACNKIKDLKHVNRIYTHFIRNRDSVSSSVGNYLVMVFAKFGVIDIALQILKTVPRRTVFSWTAVISAYIDSDQCNEAFRIYYQMQEDGVQPDSYTFVALIKACASISDLKKGRELHEELRIHGFGTDLFVCNALISMYGKCGAVAEAETVFQNMPRRNVVSWSSMMFSYVEQGQATEALCLYRQMQEEGVPPDQYTFLSAIQACSTLASEEEFAAVNYRFLKHKYLEIGKALHADSRAKGLSKDPFVGSALLSMYGRCGAVCEAEEVLWSLPLRNIIIWNVMLTVYVEHDEGAKALLSYQKIIEECRELDDVTFLCVLQACSKVGFLEICRYLHFDIVCTGNDQVLYVAASLVHAYGSCVSMKDAQAVFNELPKPHISSWNACVEGHAGEGDFDASLYMFEEMKLAVAGADEVSFLLALSACSHCGLTDQGILCFESMCKDYGLQPDLRHYGIMFNLLGRCGSFKLIEGMLRRMPFPANSTIWFGLLGACHTHGNINVAKHAFDEVVKLHPQEATPYVLMSNIYANAGLQHHAAEIEISRKLRCGEDFSLISWKPTNVTYKSNSPIKPYI